MSTIWRGLCLDHNPAIEFDLFDGGHEIKHASLAISKWRERSPDMFHHDCDVMIGGYSYPLVAVACPCERHLSQKVWPIEELRLVQAAALAGVTHEVSEWLRHNSCWTLERLAKVLG